MDTRGPFAVLPEPFGEIVDIWKRGHTGRTVFRVFASPHYYFTVRQPVSTYTYAARERETLLRSRALSVLLLDLTSFCWPTPFSAPAALAGRPLLPAAIMAKDKSFHSAPLSWTSGGLEGWLDVADVIVFDGDFRSSVKRLCCLIERAPNRPGPGEAQRNGRRFGRLQFQPRYTYIRLLPDYSF